MSAALDEAVRPFLGLSIAGAQLQADPRAHGRATSESAVAVAEADTVSFRRDAFDPQTAGGRALIGHELAHVAQQRQHGVTTKQHVKNTVEEQGLDEALESEKGMDAYLDKQAKADKKVANVLDKNPDTAKKSARDRIEVRYDIQRLIRLRAIKLMAAHRAKVMARRDREIATLDASKQSDPVKDGKPEGDNKAGLLEGYRAAFSREKRLKQIEGELKVLKGGASLIATFARRGQFVDAAQKLAGQITHVTNAQRDIALKGPQAALKQKKKSDYLIALTGSSRYLKQLRETQIVGTVQARSQLYTSFPALAKMQKTETDVKPDPSDMHGGSVTEVRELTDDELDKAIREGYQRTLNAISSAIGKIAGGGHEMDMPIPRDQVRGMLKGEQVEVFKKMVENHKFDQFWLNIGLPVIEAAIAVVPVVGPIAATAIGLATAGVELKDGLEKYAISQGTSNPLDHPLGMAPVGNFELAMIALGAVLMAFEGAAIFKAIGGAGGSPAAKAALDYASGLRSLPGGEDAANAYLSGYARQVRLDATTTKAKLTAGEAASELQDLASGGRLHGPRGARRAEFGHGENKVIWEEKGVGVWCRRKSPCSQHHFDIPDGPSVPAETPDNWVTEMRARIDTIQDAKLRAETSGNFEAHVLARQSNPDAKSQYIVQNWETRINEALPKGLIPARYQDKGFAPISLDHLDGPTRKRAEDLLEKRKNAKTPAEKRRYSELLGEIAAVGVVHNRYPGPPPPQLIFPDKLGDSSAAATGSGRFDAVYEVTLPNGTRQHVVVEAKGGLTKKLGDKQVPGQKKAQQGTQAYYDQTLDDMRKHCNTHATKNVCKAVKALENKQLGTAVSYEEASFLIDAQGNVVSISGQKYDTALPPPVTP